MTILQFFYLYLLTIPVFALFDLLWVGVVAKAFYQEKLAHLLGPVVWSPAIIFYLLFIVGILVFAVAPALAEQSLTKAVLLGAFLGLITYATYDLTNMALLRDWPLVVVIVDVIWGAVLTGGVATISYLIGKTLFL